MRILVVTPHPDDEVIGCGGMIIRRVAEGHTVDLVVVTIGTVYKRHQEIKVTSDVRHQELKEAAKLLGINNYSVIFKELDGKLDTLPILELITRLDTVLDEGGYDQVFFPYASHHQDHQVVYEACFSALREGARACPPSLIAMYEYTYISWAPNGVPGGRYYVDISSYMDQKMAALRAYRSQLQSAPHPVSPEAVEILARMRGMECGRKYAEMFYVLKMVD
jgi:LmbE family N-acetylglucosaminyl deacetylase